MTATVARYKKIVRGRFYKHSKMKIIKLHEEEYVTLATGIELKEGPSTSKKTALANNLDADISQLIGLGESAMIKALSDLQAQQARLNHIDSSIATTTCLRLAKNR